MTRLALVIDLNKCILCHACTVSCKIHHDLPLGQFWNEVFTVGPSGEFPHTSLYGFPKVCMQCDKPACVSVCPARATEKDKETGVVKIYEEKCVGCRSCIVACPYGARTFDETKGTTFKCELCPERREQGKQPICVETCVGGARVFGDIDDPNSEAYKIVHGKHAVRYLEHLGTEPCTSYVPA
ncbi:MAG: 4Fe-4S dicluster domain-containing protein [Dehalococcoidales bacterium]|nr:4Fe-4S dicluster domain-containing protein [Dehalococcoidales bacterium]